MAHLLLLLLFVLSFHRGTCLVDLGLYVPQVDDVLLSDLPSDTFLHAFPEAHLRVSTSPTLRAGYAGSSQRPLVLLPLSLQVERQWTPARWVPFILETGSPYTTLCLETREYFNVSPALANRWRARFGEEDALKAWGITPPQSLASRGYNILGTNLLREGSFVVNFIGKRLVLDLPHYNLSVDEPMELLEAPLHEHPPREEIELPVRPPENSPSDIDYDPFISHFGPLVYSDQELEPEDRARITSTYRVLVLLPVQVRGANRWLNVPFLVDTGSPITKITAQTAEAFNVAPTKPYGLQFSPASDVVDVARSESHYKGVNLLGLNVISLGRLSVNFLTGHVELVVPSRGINTTSPLSPWSTNTCPVHSEEQH